VRQILQRRVDQLADRTQRVIRRNSRFARVITFDERGQGLSDRISGAPPLEQRMDDVRAVMDSVGSERAVVVGFSEGAAMSIRSPLGSCSTAGTRWSMDRSQDG
jgi:pimeloyl-ACP methyl ester carboxylesterase